MFKSLKKFFTNTTKIVVEKVTEVKDNIKVTARQELDREVMSSWVKLFNLNVEKFENDWISGNGMNDYTEGVNHQWFGPQSVVLEGDDIHLKSVYQPEMFNNERYEYCSSGIMSTQFFGEGCYEFEFKLPIGGLVNPRIELLTKGNDTITLFSGESDHNGNYKRFETVVDGKYQDFKVSDVYGEQKISCLYYGKVVEVYHNDLLIRKQRIEESEENKINIVMSRLPEIEERGNLGASTMVIKGITYYKKK